MKTVKPLLFLFCIILISCGEDRRPEYAPRTNLNQWIYDTMTDHYLWFEDIPDSKGLNFHERPETFFSKLLSSHDGKSSVKFSTEDFPRNDVNTRSEKSVEYGFEFEIKAKSTKSKQYYARILYTVDNSPASEAGLERGEWILSINGIPLTSNTMDSLVKIGNAVELETGHLISVKDEEDEKVDILTPVEPVTTKSLGAARILQPNPILYSNIDNIFERNGKKIGYLVYNSFKSGIDEDNPNDVVYLNELSALANQFKAAGVDEFILDMRYNPGGELNRPVPLICTMLAPATAIGELMGYTIYNEKYPEKRDNYYFSTDHLRGGSNLNLNRVFVLVSNKTASASEAVINFLNPYMDDVILIGNGTYGKNVGTQLFQYEVDPRYKMYPVVCKLANSEGFYEYENGFTVESQLRVNETDSVTIFPFGHPEEYMLKVALSVIDESLTPGPDPDPDTRNVIPSGHGGSSLDRYKKPAMIIR